MTPDTAIAVQVRLNTARLALHAAIGEAMQPLNVRDDELCEALLESLRYLEEANMRCHTIINNAPHR